MLPNDNYRFTNICIFSGEYIVTLGDSEGSMTSLPISRTENNICLSFGYYLSPGSRNNINVSLKFSDETKTIFSDTAPSEDDVSIQIIWFVIYITEDSEI